MKTAIVILAAVLLCGCNQKSVPPIQPVAVEPAKEIRWEYKVETFDFSSLPDAIAIAKNNLVDAQHGLALAKIQQSLAIAAITSDAASSSNVDAHVDLKIKKDDIEAERAESIRTNLLAGLNARSEWELVSTIILPSDQKNILLIFKRPQK